MFKLPYAPTLPYAHLLGRRPKPSKTKPPSGRKATIKTAPKAAQKLAPKPSRATPKATVADRPSRARLLILAERERMRSLILAGLEHGQLPLAMVMAFQATTPAAKGCAALEEESKRVAEEARSARMTRPTAHGVRPTTEAAQPTVADLVAAINAVAERARPTAGPRLGDQLAHAVRISVFPKFI